MITRGRFSDFRQSQCVDGEARLTLPATDPTLPPAFVLSASPAEMAAAIGTLLHMPRFMMHLHRSIVRDGSGARLRQRSRMARGGNHAHRTKGQRQEEAAHISCFSVAVRHVQNAAIADKFTHA